MNYWEGEWVVILIALISYSFPLCLCPLNCHFTVSLTKETESTTLPFQSGLTCVIVSSVHQPRGCVCLPLPSHTMANTTRRPWPTCRKQDKAAQLRCPSRARWEQSLSQYVDTWMSSTEIHRPCRTPVIRCVRNKYLLLQFTGASDIFVTQWKQTGMGREGGERPEKQRDKQDWVRRTRKGSTSQTMRRDGRGEEDLHR